MDVEQGLLGTGICYRMQTMQQHQHDAQSMPGHTQAQAEAHSLQKDAERVSNVPALVN